MYSYNYHKRFLTLLKVTLTTRQKAWQAFGTLKWGVCILINWIFSRTVQMRKKATKLLNDMILYCWLRYSEEWWLKGMITWAWSFSCAVAECCQQRAVAVQIPPGCVACCHLSPLKGAAWCWICLQTQTLVEGLSNIHVPEWQENWHITSPLYQMVGKSFHKALVWSGDIRHFESTHSLDQSLQVVDDPGRPRGQTATFPALGWKSFSSVKAAGVIWAQRLRIVGVHGLRYGIGAGAWGWSAHEAGSTHLRRLTLVEAHHPPSPLLLSLPQLPFPPMPCPQLGDPKPVMVGKRWKEEWVLHLNLTKSWSSGMWAQWSPLIPTLPLWRTQRIQETGSHIQVLDCLESHCLHCQVSTPSSCALSHDTQVAGLVTKQHRLFIF